MLLLKAVNIILRKLGEIDVPSLDEPYPTLAIVLPALDEQRQTLLKEGWWFNTMYEWEAAAAPDGTVSLPANTLMFYPKCPKYTFDGKDVVNYDNHDPIIGEAVTGKLVVDKEFERLPYTAAMCITYAAAFDTYTADIGPDKTSEALSQQLQGFAMQLSAEHTRSLKRNSQTKPQFQQWRRKLIT